MSSPVCVCFKQHQPHIQNKNKTKQFDDKFESCGTVCIDIEAHLDGWKFMNKKSKAKGAQDGAPADETMGLMPQQTPDKREGMTQAE